MRTSENISIGFNAIILICFHFQRFESKRSSNGRVRLLFLCVVESDIFSHWESKKRICEIFLAVSLHTCYLVKNVSPKSHTNIATMPWQCKYFQRITNSKQRVPKFEVRSFWIVFDFKKNVGFPRNARNLTCRFADSCGNISIHCMILFSTCVSLFPSLTVRP